MIGWLKLIQHVQYFFEQPDNYIASGQVESEMLKFHGALPFVAIGIVDKRHTSHDCLRLET